MVSLSLLLTVLALAAAPGFLETGAQPGFNQVRFVGSTFDKALFVFAHAEPIWHTMDYCIMNGIYPASIDSARENELVAAYAGNHSRPIWLPAMDHGHEGSFTWLKNGAIATTFSDWDDSYPVQNRSANCLVMGTNGKVHAESCSREFEGVEYHLILCESTLTPSTRSGAELRTDSGDTRLFSGEVTSSSAIIPIPSALIPIGEAGGKMYYYNEDSTYMNFGDALDLCHSYGMKLATPETSDEQTFLKAYSLELAQAGNNDPFLWTSGSDVGTPNCTSPNSRFRWLTTLTDVEIDEGLWRNFRHGCIVVTPSQLYASGCCEGCGPNAAAVCEMSLGQIIAISLEFLQSISIRTLAPGQQALGTSLGCIDLWMGIAVYVGGTVNFLFMFLCLSAAFEKHIQRDEQLMVQAMLC